MADFNVVKTNSKGIDAAIDMIEKAITDLERRVAEKPKPSCSSNHILLEKEPDLPKKKRKMAKKSPVVSALIRKSKPEKMKIKVKRTSNKCRNNENNFPSKKKLKIRNKTEREESKKTKIPIKKILPRLNDANAKNNPKMFRYAEPTLCSQMKFNKCNTRQWAGRNLQLPFVSSVSQSKSHNLGTVIQENLGHLKLNPLNEVDHDSSEITEEDIEAAVDNVGKEIQKLKRK